MKKLLLSVASMAMGLSAMAITWVMPGTYQGWSLENNLFQEENGVLTQTIADLYADFKIVAYDGQANWNNAWGVTSGDVQNGVAYTMTKGGDNLSMEGAAENLHYYNAKVTITPSNTDDPMASETITILVEAERVAAPANDTWQLVGDAPLAWNWTAPEFTEGTNGEWTLALDDSFNGKFKIVKNKAWTNAYTTEGAVEINKEYTINGPKDPATDMSTGGATWEKPVFTFTLDGTAMKLKVTLNGQDALNEVEVNDAPAVYYNLQGVRVDNPVNGLYICKQGNTVTKVIK